MLLMIKFGREFNFSIENEFNSAMLVHKITNGVIYG